ncbi:MAG: PEP/pyruvate-binding domain-containing protein [Candidatus Azotimanducaceae bacterium]
MTDQFIVALDSSEDSLEVVGGKGRSLAKMTNAGFHVPGGFQVTTSAYRSFVSDNKLQERILDLAKPSVVEGRASFEQSSIDIQALFASTELSTEIISEIKQSYDSLDSTPPVAVRSSANAEDLPGLSFAGQQETYLNVTGSDAVVTAVKNCWSSLWTAQAISYRHQNGIEQDSVAMAVVVQIMVPSEVSGILFTANPATGERNEIIINASFGLGEAVVSGQVTPDTYIVNKNDKTVKETIIGPKEQKIISDGKQGVRMENVSASEQGQSSLSESMLSELVDTVMKVEQLYEGLPQDIEWAFSKGKLHLLQSRPITNLPLPPLKNVSWPEIENVQLLKRQVAENMPDPLSPLFQDLYLKGLFDSQKWPEGWEWEGIHTKTWLKNFVVTTVNGYAYQPISLSGADEWKGYMDKLGETQKKQPWYKTLKGALKNKYLIDELKNGRFHFIYLIARFYRSFKRYPVLKHWETKQLPEYLANIERWDKVDPGNATENELLQGLRDLSLTEAKYWQALRGVIGTAKATDGGFQSFLEENAPGEGLISGSFLSGFTSRTLDAEVAMRAIATQIRETPSLYELTILTPAKKLLDTLGNHAEGKAIKQAINQYLHQYGRQVFNLDFVEPTLEEASEPFAMSLKAMVKTPGFDLNTRQKEVSKNRRRKLWQALKFFKGKQRLEFLQYYWTARINYPAREEALFYMGLAWSTLRPWALEMGRRMKDIGTFKYTDDIFYITSEGLETAIAALANNEALPSLGQQAQKERELRAMRLRMDQPPAIPPLKESKNTANPLATIRSNDNDSETFTGFAVSPGKITGIASVIMNPGDFDKMEPNSILVCPLTTPAWTQLFPHAIALVTDIGSILAHGSIVAREYGIPAVLGIGNGTQRIKSGDRLEIDGNLGIVKVLKS